jgi:hypothetical protein
MSIDGIGYSDSVNRSAHRQLTTIENHTAAHRHALELPVPNERPLG